MLMIQIFVQMCVHILANFDSFNIISQKALSTDDKAEVLLRSAVFMNNSAGFGTARVLSPKELVTRIFGTKIVATFRKVRKSGRWCATYQGASVVLLANDTLSEAIAGSKPHESWRVECRVVSTIANGTIAEARVIRILSS